MAVKKALLVLAAFVCIIQSGEAHTRMGKPRAMFPKGLGRPTHWVGAIDGGQFVKGKYNETLGVKGVADAMRANGTRQTLREFIADHVVLQKLASNGTALYDGVGTPFTPTIECGHSLTNGTRQPYPPRVDMPWGHAGRCEIWCDNTRLFFNANCQGNNVGEVAIDAAKCRGASLLQATMLAVHSRRWQVFTNCVPMEGGTETDPKKVINMRGQGKDEVGKDTDGGAAPTTAPVPATTPTMPATPSTPATTSTVTPNTATPASSMCRTTP